MNTVTREVGSRDKSNKRFLSAALEGDEEGAFIEAARRAGRDIKAVHGDIQCLLKAGILEKTDEGKVVFPFDAVHVDFMLNVGHDPIGFSGRLAQ